MESAPRSVVWVGSSIRGAVRVFTPGVRRDIGQALYTAEARRTGIHSSKPLRGFGGSSVLEIVAPHYSAPLGERCLRGALCGRYLCAACISKEIEAGHCYTEERNGTDPPAVKRSGTRTQGEAKLTWPDRKTRLNGLRKTAAKSPRTMEKAAETSLPSLGLPPSRTGTAEGAAHTANLPTDQTTQHQPKTEAGKCLGIEQPHVFGVDTQPGGFVLGETPRGLPHPPGSGHRDHPLGPQSKRRGEVSVVASNAALVSSISRRDYD